MRTSNDAIISKITVNFWRISPTLAVGPMYWAISATASFERPNYALPDHWLWIMVFDTLYLMVPLFKGHFSITGHSFATEGVDLGVPKCKPNTSILMRCPTSGSAAAGLRGWGGGPRGTHPPPGCTGAGVGDGCPGGTHLPPLGKVTSWSSSLKLPLPEGLPQGAGWGLLGGACCLWSAISWWRSSMSCYSSWSVRSPSSAWRHHRVPPHWWGLPVGELVSSSSSEGGDCSLEG